jgi:hypothetical protein
VTNNEVLVAVFCPVREVLAGFCDSEMPKFGNFSVQDTPRWEVERLFSAGIVFP